jgi:transmembrane sensor
MMGQSRPYADDARRTEAADWVVRLQAADLEPADALAFDAWLAAAPGNAQAFDQALAVWTEYGREARAVAEGLSARRAPRPLTRRFAVAAGALAAAAAAAVVLLPQLQSPAHTEAYATARGEHRTLALADGSTIELDGGTRITVALGRDARRVALAEGQAVFDVTHDARRPFLIAAGDRTVRVVGTQFDVRRRAGKLAVTVARGVVEVRPADGASGQAYRLHPGQRLEHAEGAPAATVAAVSPEEVLGWRAGRLVFRDQPLADVVADLNAQFSTPIRIDDPELAALPVSGVLILDDEDAVVRRLALLVSARTVRSGAGVALRR